MNPKYAYIRKRVKGIYVLQDMRIGVGNRLVSHFIHKLGLERKEARDLLSKLRKEYRSTTEGLLNGKGVSKEFINDGIITDEVESYLIDEYLEHKRREEEEIKRLAEELEGIPIYEQFLRNVTGVGTLMSGVIIGEVDISKDKYVSNLWSYAGLGVIDGKGQCKCVLKEKEVVKGNKIVKQKTLGYNLFLKSKLIGVLGVNFLRMNSPYKEYYDIYKAKLESSVEHKDKTKIHRHRMAVRYMIKMFLKDLYVKWRELENLPVYNGYMERLGDVNVAA